MDNDDDKEIATSKAIQCQTKAVEETGDMQHMEESDAAILTTEEAVKAQEMDDDQRLATLPVDAAIKRRIEARLSNYANSVHELATALEEVLQSATNYNNPQ